MNYLYRTYTSSNPAGVQINLGVYALVECICTDGNPQAILDKWCGTGEHLNHREKRDKRHDGSKTKKIIRLLRKDNTLRNTEIAKRVGCTREMVTIVLRRLGIGRRNRWDGYISEDPRYSKNKKEAQA